MYNVKTTPVNKKLNSRSLWKSLLTSLHRTVNLATCFNEDKDDSSTNRQKSGILNPQGYSKLLTKAGYG